MSRAHREVPAVTWVEECDFEGVELERLLATVVKACADTLVEFPELNARFEGDAIVYLDRYDLGVAVQTDDGLVVVVVRDVSSKAVEELHEEVGQLAERARSGQLKPEEVRGSTFTVTSAGKLAGLFQTPIVNHPEVAILSMGALRRGRSSATTRSPCGVRGRSRCRSTIASSTARARRRSASR